MLIQNVSHFSYVITFVQNDYAWSFIGPSDKDFGLKACVEMKKQKWLRN